MNQCDRMLDAVPLPLVMLHPVGVTAVVLLE